VDDAMHGDAKFEGLSKYNSAPGFPGYALCCRAGMERQASYQSESEAKIFAWTKDSRYPRRNGEAGDAYLAKS
jgi:hypothetical protein